MSNKKVGAKVLVSITDTHTYNTVFIVAAKAQDNNQDNNLFVRSLIFEDYFQAIYDLASTEELHSENSKFRGLKSGLYVCDCIVWAEEYTSADGTDYDAGVSEALYVRPFSFSDYSFFFGD